MRRTSARLAPIAWSAPRSRCFSITIIVSAPTMLNAATTMMSARMADAAHFSSFMTL